LNIKKTTTNLVMIRRNFKDS